MKITVEANSLFYKNKKQLLPYLDGLRISDLNRRISDICEKEIIFHKSGAGIINLDKETIIEISNGLNELNIHSASFHLGGSARKVDFIDIAHLDKGKGNYVPIGCLKPTSEQLNEKEMLAIIEENLSIFSEHYRGQISLENLDYIENGAYEIVTNPKFITEVIDRFDTGFVFDIAHARTSFELLKEKLKIASPKEYFLALPLDKLTQIHLSHPDFYETKNHPRVFRDLHLPPKKEDYEQLDSILDNIPNKSNIHLIGEFFNDKGNYAEKVKELSWLYAGID